MIAALLWLLAQAGGASASWSARQESVALGEPIELVLEVEHALDAALRVPDGTLGLDDSWVVLSCEEPRTHPLGGGRARTTLRASVASLEPGERELAPLRLELVSRAQTVALVATPPRVSVASVLGDADHERPPKGFRARLELPPQADALPWLVGLAVLGASTAGFLLGRRLRRRAQAPPAAPDALARLGALERSDLERGEAAREAHFELTRLLRGEIDRRAGVVRAALDDDEWLERALADAGLVERLGPERERLGALLLACREVKYGGGSATHWAARERIGGARAILARLEQSPRPEEAHR